MTSRIKIPYFPLFQAGSIARHWLEGWMDNRREDQQRGWALVVPESIDPIFMVMLRGLMEHRQRTLCQRGGRLEVFRFRKGESCDSFIRYHGLGGDNVKSRPYYLLLIGGTRCLPISLEQTLTNAHAVGRLELPIPEAYLHYVSNLIRVETRAIQVNRGVTFLNHTEEGVQVAERFMREAASSKWRVCEMSSHPHGDGTRALSLHVARDNEQRLPWSNGEPVLREAPLDPSGQVIVRVEDNSPSQPPHPYHHRSSTHMLSHPFGSALAMIHLHPAHASQGMHAALTGLLAGLPVGASLHTGPAPERHSRPSRPKGYRISGDPAACLG